MTTAPLAAAAALPENTVQALPFHPVPPRPSASQAWTSQDHVSRLSNLREVAIRGDELATERQRAKGKLTARERLELLLDDGSFTEIDLLRRQVSGKPGNQPHTDGVITGSGTVHG